MYVAKLLTRLYLMALVVLTTPSQSHATGAPMIINEVAFKKLPGQAGLGVWLPESFNPVKSAITQLQRDLQSVQQLIKPHFSLVDVSVVLMPHNLRAKANFVIHSPTTLHYHFNPARKNRDFKQMATSALYRAKRQQFDNSNSAFNQLVSTGLALHFVEAVMKPKVLFQPKARGYQLVARHFAQYPGSHEGDTYALDHQLFEQHLATLDVPSHNPHQYG
ncbi:MAG: hypothetical protein HRT35_09270 [Algicola sp.]|nr:hypothetical protein [Algicola sp.]